jgi:ATP-dependent metalloprotease
MIREWGMGPWKFNTNVAYAYNEQYKNTSSAETGREIELNIKHIVDTSLQSVEGLLHSKRAQLDVLAHALMEKETLYYRDLVAILEPERAPDDIEKEMSRLSERRLVGKPPVIDVL